MAGEPFNVISPAGDQGGLPMIAQINEASRQRGFQARQDAAAQEHDKQMEQQRIAAEESFRARERYWAKLANDHQEELNGINEQTQDAITRGDDAAKELLLKKRAEIGRNKTLVESKIQGLTTLKAANDGWFNRDFTDENGAGIGAQFMRHMKDLEMAHFQKFQNLDGMLGQVLSGLDGPASTPSLSRDSQVHIPTLQEIGSDPVWAGGTGGLVEAGAYGVADHMMGASGFAKPALAAVSEQLFGGKKKGPSQQDVGLHVTKKGEVEPARYPTPEMKMPGTFDGPQPPPRNPVYNELAQALASTAAGDGGTLGALAPTIATMLTMLEKADSDPMAKESVRQLYKQALQQGADPHLLDKSLWQVWNTLKTQGQASRMAAAQVAAGPMGDGKQEVGTKEAAAATEAAGAGRMKLARMLENLGTMTEVDPVTGRSKALLQNWDPSTEWDHINKQPVSQTRNQMVTMMQTLAGARDPEHLLDLLTNDDPGDDPKELSFVGKLHPDARRELIQDLKDIKNELKIKRGQLGLGAESVFDLPDLQRQSTELGNQYNMDIPTEAGVLQAGEHAKARQKAMQQKKKLGERDRKRALELYQAELADGALGDQ